MTQLVSFDIWGTLLRTNAAYRRIQRELLYDALGYSGTLADLRDALHVVYADLDRETERHGTQFGLVDRVTRLAKWTDCMVPSEATLAELKSSLTDAQIQNMPRLTEDTLSQTFAHLREAGMEIAVISNTNMTDGSVVHLALEHHGLAQFVDYEIYSDELGFAKPDPRIFGALAELSGATPDSIVHVGDNAVTDKRGAESFGFGAILYDRRQRHPQSAQVIWSHNELPGRLT